VKASCPYLVVDIDAQSTLGNTVDLPEWAFLATLRRPTDKNENVALYKRVSEGGAAVQATIKPP
jgi:hypothetical protein